jgi:hypothetical protein
VVADEEVVAEDTTTVPPCPDPNSTNSDDEEQDKQEQQKRAKKRKILKSFRVYTNPQEDEGRFKEWSHRATNDMGKLSTTLKRESETTRAKLFRAAYRLNFREKLKNGKKKRVMQESAPIDYENDIWGLGGLTEVEI